MVLCRKQPRYQVEDVNTSNAPNTKHAAEGDAWKRKEAEFRVQMKRWAVNTQTAFATAWWKELLESQTKEFSSQRAKLSLHLFAVLNSYDPIQTVPDSAHLSHSSSPPSIHSDQEFVSVDAINQVLGTGLSTAAAVLTRRNGQTLSINTPGVIGGGRGHSTHYNANACQSTPSSQRENHQPRQREDLENQADLAPSQTISQTSELKRTSKHSIHHVVRGNQYGGPVAVSDHATLHMGDTHMGHNKIEGVSIQNLVVVNDSKLFSQSSNSDPIFARLPSIPSNRPELQSFRPIRIRQQTEVLHTILQVLRFPDDGYRESIIEEPHCNTFRWALDDYRSEGSSILRDWLLHGRNCFWIQGKAGSGKSTLMKYLYQKRYNEMKQCLTNWSKGKDLLIVPFFFWHLGTPLQKSHEGILRSIIRQVLERRPGLAPTIFPTLYIRLLDDTERLLDHLPFHDLRHAIDILVARLPEDLALFMLIDGIDEYDGDHFTFCQFLTELTEKCSGVKILVSSRPIPACHQIFSRYPNLRLQDLTIGDIQGYINEKLIQDPLLQDMDQIHTGFANQVMETLTNKASGVFLWVVLVVKQLAICLGNFDNQTTIMSRIDELPSEIEELYDHMFGKLTGRYQRDGSKILQLVCQASEGGEGSIDALQIFFADEFEGQYDGPAAQQTQWNTEDEDLRIRRCEGRLRSRCCGLLEVHRRTIPRIEFLHRTVLEYLTQKSIWYKLRSLYPIETSQTDAILLAAAVRALRWASPAGAPSRQSNLLTMSLVHYNHLRAVSKNDYDNQIEVADQVVFEIHMDVDASFDAYNAAYCSSLPSKMSTLEALWLAREVHAARPKSIVMAILIMALRGNNTLLEKRLATGVLHQDAEWALLLFILQFFDDTKVMWENSQHLSKSCEVLLSYADPNESIRVSRIFGSNKYVNSAALLSTSQEHITPWHLWLTYLGVRRPKLRLPELEDVQVTDAFLEAGADVRASYADEAKLIRAILDTGRHHSGDSRKNKRVSQPNHSGSWENAYSLLQQATRRRSLKHMSPTQTPLQSPVSSDSNTSKWSARSVFKHLSRKSRS